MPAEMYDGRRIRIVIFDDASNGEHVLEFVDPAVSATDAVVAIFNTGKDWNSAQVSISPRVNGVSARFLAWALEVGRKLTDSDNDSSRQEG